ncbi:MAG: hypothetical protein N3D85_00715 [Candidatus Bathyarchaeota archaeon]|nr:hypothetical protein [Candidatus Bathyarchaeota archaeon]
MSSDGSSVKGSGGKDEFTTRTQYKLRRRRLKTEVVAVRLMPGFKRILEQLARNEGLDLSAWMRNLIIKELKVKGIIRDSASAFGAVEGTLE